MHLLARAQKIYSSVELSDVLNVAEVCYHPGHPAMLSSRFTNLCSCKDNFGKIFILFFIENRCLAPRRTYGRIKATKIVVTEVVLQGDHCPGWEVYSETRGRAEGEKRLGKYRRLRSDIVERSSLLRATFAEFSRTVLGYSVSRSIRSSDGFS